MSPGESEISVPSPLPYPPGLLSWGVPPAVGMVGPEDPRPKSLQSWREVGLVMGFFLHHLRPFFWGPWVAGSLNNQGPLPVEDLLDGVI